MAHKEAAEGEDPKSISLEQRIKHKNWECRAHGFEELAKTRFPMADSPDDADYKKYASSIKNFVQDTDVITAHEKGLEAACAFVNYASPRISGKVCADVVAGIIAKCFTAPPKQKEKGIEIILLYFEIGKQEATLEELIKGLTNKSSKIVSGCLSVMRDALRTFGPKYVTLKTIIKPTVPLLGDRYKSVRDEARALLSEVYRWNREAIPPTLEELKPAQMIKLELEFDKHNNMPRAVAEKRVRSKQAEAKVKAEVPAAGQGDVAADGAGAAEEVEEVKAEDLTELVNISTILTEDFYKDLQSTNWSDRKKSLVTLEDKSTTPKIAEGDFGELISILKRIIATDSNIVCVALGGKCLSNMSKGLDKKFSPFSHSCISIILEKFTEKNATVVTALRDAIDGCFLSSSLEQISRNIIEFLDHKSASVTAETTMFLVRCFSKFNPEDLPEKLLKDFLEALIKNTNDPDATVRDSAFEAIGTAYEVVGEKTMGPFLVDLDDIKKNRIEEYRVKAVSTAPKRKAHPPSAAGKAEPGSKAEAKAVPGKKPVVRPDAKPAAKLTAPAKPPSENDGDALEAAYPAESVSAPTTKVVGVKGKSEKPLNTSSMQTTVKDSFEATRDDDEGSSEQPSSDGTGRCRLSNRANCCEIDQGRKCHHSHTDYTLKEDYLIIDFMIGYFKKHQKLCSRGATIACLEKNPQLEPPRHSVGSVCNHFRDIIRRDYDTYNIPKQWKFIIRDNLPLGKRHRDAIDAQKYRKLMAKAKSESVEIIPNLLMAFNDSLMEQPGEGSADMVAVRSEADGKDPRRRHLISEFDALEILMRELMQNEDSQGPEYDRLTVKDLLKKHSKRMEDFLTHQQKVSRVSRLALELIDEGSPAVAELEHRREALLAQWSVFRTLAQEKEEGLNEKILEIFRAEYEDLISFIGDNKGEVQLSHQSTTSARAGMARLHNRKSNVDMRQTSFRHFLLMSESLIETEHPAREEIAEKRADVCQKWEALQDFLRVTDMDMQLSVKLMHFYHNYEEARNWANAQEAVLSNENIGETVDDISLLLVQVQDFVEELKARRPKAQASEDLAGQLIEKDHPAAKDISERRNDLLRRERALMDLARERWRFLLAAADFRDVKLSM